MRLPPERRPDIRRFGFGRDLAALADNDLAQSPMADETRLYGALEELAGRFGDGLPFGVFVFSDGRSTDREPVEDTARAYRALGLPVHVVPLGDERISGDVAIADIDAPRDVRPGLAAGPRDGAQPRFCGKEGRANGTPVSDPHAEPIAMLPLTLADGEQTPELVIESDRAKGALARRRFLRSRTRRWRRTTRSRFRFHLGTRSCASSTWREPQRPNTASCRTHFRKTPTSSARRCWSATSTMPCRGFHALTNPGRGFPTTREELFSYDVVICSDITRTAFSDEQLAWTAELVGKRGGGFAMIGGMTSFGSGGWDQTVWDGLIPVDMSGRGPQRSEYYQGTLRVVIPPQAMDHPIWRIVDNPERNREVLAALPTFYGTNLTDRLKPAATALGLSAGPVMGSRVVTVFSCQTFGRGRTFAMSSDSTVDWGRDFETIWGEGDNRYFRKFWRNVVRWLAENSEATQRRLRVETDKVIYRPGQDIQIKARAYDEKIRETNSYRVAARLARPNEPESSPFDATADRLTPEPKERSYGGKLIAPRADQVLANPGSTLHKFRLDVAAFDGDRIVATSSVPLQIIDDPVEFHDPRPIAQPCWNWQNGPEARRSRIPLSSPICWDVIRMHRFASSSIAGRCGTIPCSGCCCWDCWHRNG